MLLLSHLACLACIPQSLYFEKGNSPQKWHLQGFQHAGAFLGTGHNLCSMQLYLAAYKEQTQFQSEPGKMK